MEINLKNKKIANLLSKNQIKVEQLGKEFSIEENMPLSIEEVIKAININKILNNSFKNNLNIHFENFNLIDSITYNIKNIFNKNLIESAAYNKKTKSIHVNKNLFVKELSEIQTFSDYLYKQTNLQDFINIVVLHEIGHAFNHAHILETNKNLTESSKCNEFFNKTVLFNQYPNIPQLDNLDYLNPSRNMYLATSEGFADMYCAIALTQLYSEEKAVNLIETIVGSRKKADEQNRECYQTQGMLNKFLDDFRNNDSKIQFKDFSQMYDYMSSVIGEQALITLSANLKSSGKVEQTFNSQYLGFINGYLDLQTKTPQNTIQRINEDYGLNLPVSSNYNQNLFDHWTIQGKNNQQNSLKKAGHKMKVEASITQLRTERTLENKKTLSLK